jgi:phage terminase large subunit GpA-like protein
MDGRDDKDALAICGHTTPLDFHLLKIVDQEPADRHLCYHCRGVLRFREKHTAKNLKIWRRRLEDAKRRLAEAMRDVEEAEKMVEEFENNNHAQG